MMSSSRFCTFTLALCALTFGVACSDGARVVGLPEEATGSEPEDMSEDEGEGGGNESGPPGSAEDPPVDESTPGGPPSGGGGTGASMPPDMPARNPVPEPLFTAPRGPCDFTSRVGRFSIEKQVDFGVVQGTVDEGVVPTSIPRIVSEIAGCKLLERRNLACIPGCVGAETCGESGTCIPYPRQVSVGEVTISGLTKETIMSPQQPGNSYFAPGADNPPYEVQSKVVLSAEGAGDVGSFQLFGVGSEPLAESPRWVLERGADLTLTWAAPTSSVEATVLVELTIDQHGISPLSLSCELEDTGSATVPAAAVDQLINSGVSGFPNGRIIRRTADHIELGAGCVELVVGSPLAASVSVSGFTPCNGQGDCPSGQACNVPLQRCE
jgi:hypothetical protein